MSKILRLTNISLGMKTPIVACLQIFNQKHGGPNILSKNNIYCFKQSKKGDTFHERFYSSFITKSNFFQKIKSKYLALMSDSTKINIGACLCYEKCADEIDYHYFMNFFKLPDTFYSWFLCIQLHVWMIALVSISEKNGRVFRNRIIEEMWNDVEQRIGHLTTMRSSTKKQNLKELSDQFQAALIGYDEGILEDDKALAAAAWRVFFGFKVNTNPRLLECLVLYIRKQIAHLDSLNSEEMMFYGKISFLPLNDIITECNNLSNA